MSTVSSREVREQLPQLLERAFYNHETIKVQRNRRDMAWIVGVPVMEQFQKALAVLLKENPELADSLAIELNLELQQDIEEALAEIDAGQVDTTVDFFKD